MGVIYQNRQQIQQRIHAACIAAGRQPQDVKLLLATKTVEPSQIIEALESGLNYIGENKVQELKRKHPFLQQQHIAFHFIGHLQTNKVKDVLSVADCIQSVDRLHLAIALDKQLQKEGRSMDVLLQVNTSYEASKFGVSPEEALNLAKQVAALDTLNVKGLMTIGLFSAEQEKVRRCFQLLAQLKNDIAAAGLPHIQMQELSMGMSGDFETAIREGATMVRVGTSIFGQRMYPDSYYWNEQSHQN